MKIIQISVFWKNDQPDGLDFTFGPPSFSPEDLAMMFDEKAVKNYMKNSDLALGTGIVKTMFGQLEVIAKAQRQSQEVSVKQALLAALNITWLVSRGFMPNDEHNGIMYVSQEQTQ